MDKYMRKGTFSGKVAITEVADVLLRVRTRSRTLALQRMQRSPGKGEEEPESRAVDYLKALEPKAREVASAAAQGEGGVSRQEGCCR